MNGVILQNEFTPVVVVLVEVPVPSCIREDLSGYDDALPSAAPPRVPRQAGRSWSQPAGRQKRKGQQLAGKGEGWDGMSREKHTNKNFLSSVATARSAS